MRNHINIERNKRERIGELCKYFISGKICGGKEKILIKDIDNNYTRCLSYEPEPEPEPEEEEEEDFDADEADYEDL